MADEVAPRPPCDLPFRRLDLDTENPAEIEALQPERHRSLVQLQAGDLRFRLREFGWGAAAIQNEHWSRGIRLLQDRPSSYVTYAFITQGSARWMGTAIGPGSVLRIAGPWELVSDGVLEYVAFAVGRRELGSAHAWVREPNQDELPTGYRVDQRQDSALIARRLIGDLEVLERQHVEPAVLDAIADELLHVALRLDGPVDLIPVERLSSVSSRLAVVHRVEDYLEASDERVPSIATLCAITGVCERTLEYAFREHLGVTPARYLKLRRLTVARRRLQNPVDAPASVTEIAIGCGFFQLGRFAGEYRKLFGELPSQTLARASYATCSGHTQGERNRTRTPPQSARRMLPSAHPTP